MRTFYNLGRELRGSLPDSLYDALAELDTHMPEVLRLAYQGVVSEEDLNDRAAVIKALEKIDRALARS